MSRIKKGTTCLECDKFKVCSIRKAVQNALTEGNEKGVLAVYEGDANLLSHQVIDALANACKLFRKRED